MTYGRTLPESFYQRYLKSPTAELYMSKRRGTWVPMTFAEGFQYILKTLGGLKALGLKPGETAAIFSENRYEWPLTDYALQWMQVPVAAIYTTSSSDQIKYILNESEASILFVSNLSMIEKLSTIEGLIHLKTVVAFDEVEMPKLPSGVKFISREEFLRDQMPEAEAIERLKTLSPTGMCVLLYTSGTTGEPKGVMVSHKNIMSNLETFREIIPLEEQWNTVCFLPLSHIYERVLHAYMVMSGVRIYMAESVDKLIDNLADARPDIMISVPRIFEKMYARIEEKIRNSSHLQKKIFFFALAIAKKVSPYRRTQRPIPFPWNLLYFIANQLVFKKIRAITGGKTRGFISGGAPLAPEIIEFFFDAGFLILEGYGLSETCILSVNLPTKFKFGTVGFPFKGTEISFASDGEILARGPTIMSGYFRRPDATAEVIDSEGWFHTGDIGELDEEGFLKITDRKKDLIITAAGKKVAPQPIENTLKIDSLIESVCLVGDKKAYVVALITPNLELCKGWAHSKGYELKTTEDCAHNARLRERFQRTISDLNAKLPRYSTIKDFRVLPQPFSLENGELTPTLKLKRKNIQIKYAAIIDSMYPESTPISRMGDS